MKVVAYHGTGKRFNRFDVNKSDRGTNAGFFTSTMGLAVSYGNGNPCYLYKAEITMNRPCVIDCNGSNFRQITIRGRTFDTDNICLLAQQQGFDGVVFKNVIDCGPVYSSLKRFGLQLADVYQNAVVYAVFNNNQVKLVGREEI